MRFQGGVSVKLLKTGRIRIDYLDHLQICGVLDCAAICSETWRTSYCGMTSVKFVALRSAKLSQIAKPLNPIESFKSTERFCRFEI